MYFKNLQASMKCDCYCLAASMLERRDKEEDNELRTRDNGGERGMKTVTRRWTTAAKWTVS